MILSVVPETAPEMTVSRYIARAWPLVPAFAVREAFKKRDVKVNGTRVNADARVTAGDEVCVYLPDKFAPGGLKTVFADENLIAFIKPCGLPVDADADGIGEDTALSRLQKAYPGAKLAHRLDAGTGGVMLASRSAFAEKALLQAFSDHKIEKKYMALALGRMPKKEDTLLAFLEKDADSARVRVSEKGVANAKEIETRYRVTREYTVKGITLSELEVSIPTGRTHQIRAHLSYVDHPLAGDDKYGNRAVNKSLGATEPCLWCRSLEICGALGLEAYDGMRFRAPEWKWRILS